ncbi:DUF6968 family protein [Massilia endophytica]|uniref:DUF6968 family protein n=1 Tax=Massilia endophytica TaxID=2899220 RepID=UPI001E423878|nr:hypothetical protein [Massilia endophytica]UGQ49134.1 hypothetical protein LSQ66_11920 [Massilia endophytica]
MTLAVCSRQYVATSPEGKQVNGQVEVLIPAEKGRFQWECEVRLGPIETSPFLVMGVDSWQAIQQAMHMTYVQIDHRERTGWKFLWLEDEAFGSRMLLPARGQERA